MDDLLKRLRELDESLSGFSAETFPSWQSGQIFNALLGEAKQAFRDDPVMQAITPVQQRASFMGQIPESPTDTDAGSMRAAVKQMILVAGAARPSTEA